MKLSIPLAAIALAITASAAEPVVPATQPVVPEPAADAGRFRRFYADIGPAFSRLSVTPEVLGVKGSQTTDSYYGVNAGFGTCFGESSIGLHQAGLELTLTSRSDDVGASDVTDYASSFLAVYNYNFALGDAAHLYVGPSAGVLMLSRTVEAPGSDADDSEGVLAAGAQAGFTVRCSKLVSLNFGYKWLISEDVELNRFATKYTDISVHTVKADVTFRF